MPKQKKEKYTWAIGQPLPDLDEHSQTKHLIISDYLKRYVEVYFSNTSIPQLKISIVDGFSGGGKYNDVLTGETAEGSPFVILNAIRDVERSINVDRRKPCSIDARFHFVDCTRQHTDFLRQELLKSEYCQLLENKIHIQTSLFSQAAPRVVENIMLRNNAQRSIFILDQYAYKDVPFNTVKYILDKLNGSEVILTFNVNALTNYFSENKSNRSALANIDLEPHIDWNRISLLKEAGKLQAALQEQVAHAIHQASGAKHITLFFISPKKGLTYWLVHLSKVYRARDVMMSLHWKYCNSSFSHHLSEGLFPLGYTATQIPGQCNLELLSEFDFSQDAEARCIGQLSEDIPRLIYGKDRDFSIRYSNLLDNIGSFTPAAESQIRQALTKCISNGELRIRKDSGGCRRSANQVKPDDMISYCQRPLFFI